MREEVREIEGAEDFETGKPRLTPLGYTVAWPDGDAVPRGLVFLIAGFGADAASDYAASLRRHVVAEHGLAAVSVDYHCLRSRPELGARIAVDTREHVRLLGFARLYGVEVADVNDFPALCAAFEGRQAPPQLTATLNPPGGDLQNFGLVQALDHLRVLGDIMARGPHTAPGLVIALGSSHGGYIAHLMAKIAPCTLAAVIDNSAYVQAPIAYAAGGALPEWGTNMGGVELWCRTARAFSFDDRAAPDFYGRDQDLIRDAGYPPHLQVQHAASGDQGTRFRMVNAAVDAISSPEVKARQALFLKASGFDATLQLVREVDLDGRLFKRMTHGLDASLTALADRYLPDCAARGVAADLLAGSVVEYPCVDQTYRFRHTDRFPYVVGERIDRFADLLEDGERA
jgi:hypothetical protein